MSHVLVVDPGAHGHVNPHLPVITELVKRGHRISYAISEPFAEIVTSTGATPLVHDSGLSDETRGEQWPSDPVEGMAIFLDEAISGRPPRGAGESRSGALPTANDHCGRCARSVCVDVPGARSHHCATSNAMRNGEQPRCPECPPLVSASRRARNGQLVDFAERKG